jgi:hypothetical protein
MKKLAMALGLAMAVCGCGNNKPNTVTNTSTTGNWEAQLVSNNGGQGSLLNFVVAFSVTNSGPLDITGFGFFNQGSCFQTGLNQQKESGSASFTTDTTGHVTGTLNLTITSSTTGSVLTLTSNDNGLTGTSNGTTTTTGTLSNGVVIGTWTLSPGNSGGSDCTGSGTFLMCEGTSTCTPPAAAVEPPRLWPESPHWTAELLHSSISFPS